MNKQLDESEKIGKILKQFRSLNYIYFEDKQIAQYKDGVNIGFKHPCDLAEDYLRIKLKDLITEVWNEAIKECEGRNLTN